MPAKLWIKYGHDANGGGVIAVGNEKSEATHAFFPRLFHPLKLFFITQAEAHFYF